MRFILTLVLSLAILAGNDLLCAQTPERPWVAQGYSGLRLREIPGGHVVVSWILPGPLDGRGLEAAGADIARPDLIVSVNGRNVTPDSFLELERSLFPRDRLVIEYRKALVRGAGLPRELAHEDEVHTLEVVLGSRDEWSGTIGRGGATTTRQVMYDQPLLHPANQNNIFGAAVAEHDLLAPIEKLNAVLLERYERDDDYHQLRWARTAFARPFGLPETCQGVMKWLDDDGGVREKPLKAGLRVLHDAADCMDAGAWMITETDPHGRNPVETLLLNTLFKSRIQLRTGAGLAFYQDDPTFADKCLALLDVPRETFYIQGPKAHDHIEVIRASLTVKLGSIASAGAQLGRLIMMDDTVFDITAIDQLPSALEGAVEGDILSASYDERAGWVVVGGHGDNRYDMARIDAVVDPSGNDEYWASEVHLGTSLIVDFEGDDLYTGHDQQGPAGALLGLAFIEDRAGNDRYIGRKLSCGAGMFGLGVIIDRGGEDEYSGTEWSLGAGMFGGGWILDLGNENDSYTAHFLSQGLGGPRGLGLLVDEGGNDTYMANGPVPSAYGDEGVFQSFSQGMAFGFRNFASGGVGIIYDLGGDDSYESGEFSQGGSYYYGIGILRDAAGNDAYDVSRYGQGFGVHSGIGMLVDEAGDDRYTARTAASQGAAWDLGIGMLLDKLGNDVYRAEGLAQGSAAHQSVAYLIDLDGTDEYHASGSVMQGHGGGNGYHYDSTGAFSFSLLLDLGSGDDTYSGGRSNNETMATGEMNEAEPQKSTVHGLVIDQ